MTDHDAVSAANAEFYDAFEHLDLARMEAVWLSASHVKCVHPGWGVLNGWGSVMDSWQRIFANTKSMHFDLRGVAVEVHGDVAWVVLTEVIETETDEGAGRALVQATNLFQRVDSRWWLVLHHGSPLYSPANDSGASQMH